MSLPTYSRSFLMGPTWQTKRIAYYPFREDSGMMRLSLDLPGDRCLCLHGFKPHREVLFHDHPWPFRTFVLWGSYVDESVESPPRAGYAVKRDKLRILSTRRRPARHTHRTSCHRKTWTVVLMGAWERDACQGDERTWICGQNQFFDEDHD